MAKSYNTKIVTLPFGEKTPTKMSIHKNGPTKVADKYVYKVVSSC